MAATGYLDYIDYGGYRYTVGDIITISGTTIYTNSYQSLTQTNSAYARCTFKIIKIADQSSSYWNGSSYYPINPIEITVYSGDSTIVGTGGCLKLSQIASGGTSLSYTVNLEMNGGVANGLTSMTMLYGVGNYYSIAGELPTREGYTFAGFYTTTSGGEQVYDSSGVAVAGTYWSSSGSSAKWQYTGDVTLYARWTANSYVVTAKMNDGTSNLFTTLIVVIGTTNWYSFAGNTPTRTGYAFKGLYTSTSGGSQVYSSSGVAVNDGTYWANNVWIYPGNVTLYAQWVANNYTLTVNPNGGTWNGSTATQTFTQNYATTKTIANPTRVGYTFSGWTLSGSGSLSGTKFVFGAGACTLTAKWTRIVLNVKFNASTNGGSPDSTKSVNYGDMIGKLPEPTKAFHKFVGWFTKSSGGSQISVSQVITANVTYYAQFKIDASVKVVNDGAKKPAIVWCKVSGAWKKCITWVKQNGKWYKSTGAD